MRKLISLLLLAVLVSVQALAVPARKGIVQVPQPDGTLLSLKLVGDEYYHFNTTADDYTIMLNEDGGYVYAQLDGLTLVPTQVLAHDAGSRNAQELALLANTPKRLIDETSVAQAHVRRVKRDVDMSNFDFDNFRGLVILIDFSDRQFVSENPQEFYTEMFSSENFTSYYDPVTQRNVSCPGSVRDYFNDQSNGAFKPPFDVYGPYRASYSSNGTVYPARSTQCNSLMSRIIANVVKEADGDIDYSRYDNNNDGKVDMIYFLVAGYASSSSGNNSGYLWPHASNMNYFIFTQYDGKWMDRYASSTELYGWEDTPSTVTVEGIGTVCHEFSHVLGLPDFYDTDYSGSGGESHHPDGWDVMAGGGDYDHGRCPAGYTFYERYALGWANPKTITREGSYVLNPVNTSREGYILRTPVNKEFFTIENRQRTGWDYYLPGHGMIVTRVDSTNSSVWANNKVNCNPEHNYFEMLRAGNSSSGNSSSDPFPGTSGNVMITNETTPNLTTWSGQPNDFLISGIAENNGVITFNVLTEETLTRLVEDFESMPVTTTTAEKGVEGTFATWDFTKCGVRAPGEDKANGENSVIMKLPSTFCSVTPVYYNIYMASLTVFNTSSTITRLTLEYSVKDNSEGKPIWNVATCSTGDTIAEAPVRSKSTLYWSLNLDNTQPAKFRIYEIGGHKTAATYADDFTLYYTGEEGGPVDPIPGDVNGDREISISDINAIIDVLLGGSANHAELQRRADVNGDGEVSISDINAVIDLLLK